MHKLYVIAHRRVLNKLRLAEATSQTIREMLKSTKLTIPINQDVLHRLPRDQLKDFLRMPCPVNNLANRTAKDIIQVSKTLRANVSLPQTYACSRCVFKDTCGNNGVVGDKKSDNIVSDLVVYSQALSQYGRADTVPYRSWVSGYKLTDSILSMITDLQQNGGKEIQEFQVLRQSQMKANLAMQIDSLNLQVEIDDQGKKTLIKKKQVERVVKIKKLQTEADIDDDDAEESQPAPRHPKKQWNPPKQFKKVDKVDRVASQQQEEDDIELEEDEQPTYKKRSFKDQRQTRKQQQSSWKLDANEGDFREKRFNNDDSSKYGKSQYKPRSQSNYEGGYKGKYNREQRSGGYQNKSYSNDYKRNQGYRGRDEGAEQGYQGGYKGGYQGRNNRYEGGQGQEGSNTFVRKFDGRRPEGNRYEDKHEGGNKYEGGNRYEGGNKYGGENKYGGGNRYENKFQGNRQGANRWQGNREYKGYEGKREGGNRYDNPREGGNRQPQQFEDDNPRIRVLNKPKYQPGNENVFTQKFSEDTTNFSPKSNASEDIRRPPKDSIPSQKSQKMQSTESKSQPAATRGRKVRRPQPKSQ